MEWNKVMNFGDPSTFGTEMADRFVASGANLPPPLFQIGLIIKWSFYLSKIFPLEFIFTFQSVLSWWLLNSSTFTKCKRHANMLQKCHNVLHLLFSWLNSVLSSKQGPFWFATLDLITKQFLFKTRVIYWSDRD